MFDQILVPLDGTPQSAAALPLARTLAEACHGQVVLIRVAPSPLDRDEAARHLVRIARELEASGVAVTTEVCCGVDVAPQLLWAIRDRRTDLVVMATHGRSGIQRAVMGSVAESLIRDSPVPVLLVRPGGRRTTGLHTLLVAVDGSPGGALALGSSIALARATGARIVLLEVAVPIPLWVYSAELGGSAYMPVDSSWDDDALGSAQRYVEGLARRLRQAGIEAEGRALMGEVVPTIDAVADDIDADLIVIATHARVGAARAVLGSTADAVVRTAQRPVLLVRRDTPGQSTSPVAVLATTAEGGPRPIPLD
ncbi:MAG TPA: universal stress protein [Chloroflexota bacterium]